MACTFRIEHKKVALSCDVSSYQSQLCLLPSTLTMVCCDTEGLTTLRAMHSYLPSCRMAALRICNRDPFLERRRIEALLFLRAKSSVPWSNHVQKSARWNPWHFQHTDLSDRWNGFPTEAAAPWSSGSPESHCLLGKPFLFLQDNILPYVGIIFHSSELKWLSVRPQG